MHLKMSAPSRMGARTRLTILAAALVASLATASSAQAAATFLAPQSISPTTDAEDAITGITSASTPRGTASSRSRSPTTHPTSAAPCSAPAT